MQLKLTMEWDSQYFADSAHSPFTTRMGSYSDTIIYFESTEDQMFYWITTFKYSIGSSPIRPTPLHDAR